MIIEIPPRETLPLWRRLIGRCFDIAMSLLFLLTVFPVIYILVAAFIKMRTPGPAIVRRLRQGYGGRKYHSFHIRLDNEHSLIARLPHALNILAGDMRLWVDIRLIDEDVFIPEPEPEPETIEEMVFEPEQEIIEEQLASEPELVDSQEDVVLTTAPITTDTD